MNEKYMKLAKELLAPVAHLEDSDARYPDYVKTVAAKLEAFETSIRKEMAANYDTPPSGRFGAQ